MHLSRVCEDADKFNAGQFCHCAHKIARAFARRQTDAMQAGVVISNSAVGCGSLKIEPIGDQSLFVKAALSGMLAPTLREKFLGNAEILEVFTISKVGKVAGCRVTEGFVRRGAKVRLIRDDVVIHEGVLKTLRRFKDEVREVQNGYECGMAFENYDDIKVGDIIHVGHLPTDWMPVPSLPKAATPTVPGQLELPADAWKEGAKK